MNYFTVAGKNSANVIAFVVIPYIDPDVFHGEG
jgi:hypothetical protein